MKVKMLKGVFATVSIKCKREKWRVFAINLMACLQTFQFLYLSEKMLSRNFFQLHVG